MNRFFWRAVAVLWGAGLCGVLVSCSLLRVNVDLGESAAARRMLGPDKTRETLTDEEMADRLARDLRGPGALFGK